MRKPTLWFLTSSNANRAVQPQKTARGWKLELDRRRIVLPLSENKEADQLHGNRLFVFAYAKCWFSDDFRNQIVTE